MPSYLGTLPGITEETCVCAGVYAESAGVGLCRPQHAAPHMGSPFRCACWAALWSPAHHPHPQQQCRPLSCTHALQPPADHALCSLASPAGMSLLTSPFNA